jgi:hypothetical protein
MCGNCLDDDFNGLTDSEDPACCTAEPLTVTRTRYRRGRSSVHIGATMPDGTFAGLDPRNQPVAVQVRNAAGEQVCCSIPAEQWQRLFRRTFGFFDQALAICPPIRCLCLTLPQNGQTRASMIAGGVRPDSPLLSPTEITISIGGQCASGPVTASSGAGTSKTRLLEGTCAGAAAGSSRGAVR